MGFDFSGGGFKFDNQPKPPSKRSGASAAVPEEAKEYRERQQKEIDRRKLATAGQFFVCVCFKTRGDMEAFGEKMGDGRKFVPACDVSEAIASWPSKNRDWKVKTLGAKRPDPLACVEYSGNLESDCEAEALALLDALVSAKAPKPCKHASDSDMWICLVFKSDAEAEAFLRENKLYRYGDLYLDGSAWLADVS